jgi:hypothetical protein
MESKNETQSQRESIHAEGIERQSTVPQVIYVKEKRNRLTTKTLSKKDKDMVRDIVQSIPKDADDVDEIVKKTIKEKLSDKSQIIDEALNPKPKRKVSQVQLDNLKKAVEKRKEMYARERELAKEEKRLMQLYKEKQMERKVKRSIKEETMVKKIEKLKQQLAAVDIDDEDDLLSVLSRAPKKTVDAPAPAPAPVTKTAKPVVKVEQSLLERPTTLSRAELHRLDMRKFGL